MIRPSRDFSADDVSKHYNELDHFYQSIWGEHLHHGLWSTGTESVDTAVKELARLVALEGRVQEGSRVCDVGCGYGATSQLLAEEFGAHATGLTISERQYEVARKRVPRDGSVRFLLRDWLENDLEGESFDTVIAIESSEHMTDKARFAEEVYRVLRPGGRIVICAWCASSRASKWQEKTLLQPICDEGRLPGLLSPEEYESLLESAGFADVQTMDLSSMVSPTWTRTLQKTIWHFISHPREIRSLSPQRLPSADFARSLLRIALAYKVKAMTYSLLSAEKPSH